MQTMTVPAGEAIFRAGDPSLAVFIVQEGEVAIAVGDSPTSIEVARLGPGALFGESGVLECRPRSATATAVVATTLLVTEAEIFFQAFGMDNERALSLVKLLCSRLRSTNLRAAKPAAPVPAPPEAAIRVYPDHRRLTDDYAMKPVDVRQLPFQVGNRYGGESTPLAANRGICVPARGDAELASPHFEFLRRGGVLGVRDLGSRDGTIVNGALLNRASADPVARLRLGQNEVIAGRSRSPYRFRVLVHSG